MKKVSVIVLVYYNEESLPLLFSELAKVENQLGEQDLELELIFVDDGSGDASQPYWRNIHNRSANSGSLVITPPASPKAPRFLVG